MRYFVVSMFKESGINTIHLLNCSKRPVYPNYLELGYFLTAEEAEQKAKKYYSRVNLCECCFDPVQTVQAENKIYLLNTV